MRQNLLSDVPGLHRERLFLRGAVRRGPSAVAEEQGLSRNPQSPQRASAPPLPTSLRMACSHPLSSSPIY